MANRLAGKRCLIVGGTSGLGLAAALRFLEEGARLTVAGLPGSETSAMPHFTRTAGPVTIIPCDAGDEQQVQHLFEQTRSVLGGLDVLYHVAGASGRRHGDGPLHECSLDGWRATMDANLTSAFLTNRAAIRSFREAKLPGVILNMASVLALAPSPHYFDTAAYTAAKGGLVALSRLAAASCAAAGIRVNVIAPALVETPMSTRACSDPAIRQFLAGKQPLACGPARPEDCSAAAVFLCSDESRLITGAVLPVDGGWCVSEGQYGEAAP